MRHAQMGWPNCSSPLISASYCFALQRFFLSHIPTRWWCRSKLDKVGLTWDQGLNNRSSFQKSKKKLLYHRIRPTLGLFYDSGFSFQAEKVAMSITVILLRGYSKLSVWKKLYFFWGGKVTCFKLDLSTTFKISLKTEFKIVLFDFSYQLSSPQVLDWFA